MQEYYVYWNINDGKNGYPDCITTDTSGELYVANSFEQAIRLHSLSKGVTDFTLTEVDERPFKDYICKVFSVTYPMKNSNEKITKRITVSQL